MSLMGVILFLFAASQVYWAWRAHSWIGKHTRSARARIFVSAVILVLYLALMAYNRYWFSISPSPTTLPPASAFLVAPYQWWVASSVVAFLVVILFALGRQ